MDISIIFKIAGIGIFLGVIDIILGKAGRQDIAMFATLSGVIVTLVIIVGMIHSMFDTVKTLFLF